ncbi:TonB-dependent receptor domain-containing protein [Amniculibacterium aquaticum]|uniref:TonB-dependent receptor domain-containing protein n=1 Tax=Amniculibacterium aquaticum TaxID=2479858 RepID=UPI000F5A3575|nr:TonB-dependent receptor [Amniculibacterium aquaticum]
MKNCKLSIATLIILCSSQSIFGQKKEKDSLTKTKEIEVVILQGVGKKSTENSIMSIQKKSAEVIERLGISQLEKQGIGDASTAITKATGSQKQEGSNQIFIRGLGDRNNTTTINGLPIPSNDPLLKNIDLSIIKTDMIEHIGLEKVYHPKNWGDVSGANIDISSKIYSGKPYFKINIGSGFNTNTLTKNPFLVQDGSNFWGSKTTQQPIKNKIAQIGYAFETSTINQERDTPINSSLGLDFGTHFKVGNQGKISAFGYAGFDNDYHYQKGITGGSYNGQNDPLKIYNNSEEYKYATNTTALINLNYKINPKHNLNYSSNFLHTTEQKLGLYKGYDRDFDIFDDLALTKHETQVRRATYKTNNLFINQLRGEHQISEPVKFSWNLGYNFLENQRPDRQQNISIYDKTSQRNYFASSNPGANNRYFDRLIEDDFVGDFKINYKFSKKAMLTLGYNGRYKQSDFKATQYNFKILAPQNSYSLDPNNYDAFFNLANYQSGAYFDIVTFRGDIKWDAKTALKPQYFKSELNNHAAYALAEFQINEKLTAQLGLRFDILQQEMSYNTSILPLGGTINREYQKLLPSINLKYAVNEKQNLRFSASKTYTTPLLLEVAPFEYQDIDDTSFGNIDLYPADNYNVDLKWEIFPNKSEMLSVMAFGKYIANPIARITMASSANTVSFANVGDYGTVYGAEMELRKDLFQKGKSKIYTFLNASYIHTQQELNKEKLDHENQYVTSNFISNLDKMQGASSFLANINLGWEHKWDKKQILDFVISYAYLSDNIYALGFEERGNMVDKAIHSLDSTLKLKLKSGLGISLSGKNLLNPKFERVQENKTTNLISKSYRKGSGVSLGLSYEF